MTSVADIEQKIIKKDIKKRLVKALFCYNPENIDELQLKVNDILEVIEETEEGWWKGKLDGNVGMFPSNFVIELDEVPEEFNNQLTNELSPIKNGTKKDVDHPVSVQSVQDSISVNCSYSPSNKAESKQVVTNSTNDSQVENSPAPKRPPDPDRKALLKNKNLVDSAAPRLPPKPVKEQARVMFPYQAQNEDELTLKEGDIITVLSKEIEDKGWWKGELGNRIGVFPDNFVQLLKVEEQKKPERPDKPPTVMSSKISSRSSTDKSSDDSSPKLDKKLLKTPPTKPPPPEIHKKDPERPPPPFPNKKPQLPHPMKKPSRTSVKMKLPPTFPLPTATNLPKSPVSENSPSLVSNLPANETKTENVTKPTEKGETSDKKDDLGFDAVESCEKKLIHLTANRAKVPKKRPPSHIFLKENEKSNSLVGDSRRLSEPLLGEINSINFLDGEFLKSNSGVKKLPPSRPSPPSMRKADSLPKQGTVKSASKFFSSSEDRDSHTKVSEITSSVHQVLDVASIVQQQRNPVVSQKVSNGSSAQEQKVPDYVVSVVSRKTSALVSTTSDYSTTDSVRSRDNLQKVITGTVSRTEYNELLKQVQELKDTVEKYNNVYTEAISNLKQELQEEKMLRLKIENELCLIKQCQKTV